MNGVLAPVIDVGWPTEPAVGARAFSDEPDRVAGYARGVVERLPARQGVRRGQALPRPGLGLPVHRGGPGERRASRWRELRDRDLVPFRAAIEAGVPGRGASATASTRPTTS